MDKFKTKYPLNFNSNGTFRILMMSDIQESLEYDKRSLRAVCALLDRAKPDLVILGGDNCDGREIFSYEELKTYLDIFVSPMEERKIPWAHIYGNHDYDAKCDIVKQQEMYEAYPMCVSNHTDSSVHGKSNFVLPIYDKTGSNIVFNVWGLDTNGMADDRMYASACLQKNVLGAGREDFLHFDQLMWYWNTSNEIEKMCGQKIPALLCMHVAPPEFLAATANPEYCIKSGAYDEPIDSSVLNSGIFAAVLQRGDVCTIGCGHSHENDFCGEYCGIKICFDGCVGYNERTSYGSDETRGGRLFEISEEDPWNIKTTMLHSSELL